MPDPRSKIYVVSGTQQEFNEYLQGKQNTVDYVFVDNVRKLKGLQRIKGFFIGTFENRSDIDEIKSEIEIIKLKMELRKSLGTS